MVGLACHAVGARQNHAAEMALVPGTRLGHFDICSLVGSGGMGEVYVAQDLLLPRRVALKVLRADLTTNRDHLLRFAREARAASSLNHPNILTVHEIGEADSVHFIATELIEGQTLREQLDRGPMQIPALLDVSSQIAAALSAAHHAGIVHRDIKPENLMIRRDGFIKVLDFGLAKLIPRIPTQVSSGAAATRPSMRTEPGLLLGTIPYMSPEQLRGFDVDARTDIWSLGVVLYQMITGRLPFDATTPSEMIVAVLEREPPELGRYLPAVPAELQRIVRKSLRKDREERYHAADDLLVDLRSLKYQIDRDAHGKRSQEPEGSTRVASSDQSPEVLNVADPVPRATALIPRIADALRRHRVAAITAAFVLFAVIPAALYRAFRSDAGVHPPAVGSRPFVTFNVSPVPYTDTVIRVAISPDGHYLAQVEEDAGHQSIVVRRIALPANTQSDHPGRIVQRSEATYYGLTFSNDGDTVYYVRYEKGVGTLYSVNIHDAVSTKLVEDIDSPVTLSPDGQWMAFLRRRPHEAEDRLMVANARDGSGERTLVTRKRPEFLAGLWNGCAWSPDGRLIACGFGSDAAGGYSSLVAVRAADGVEQPFTPRIWSSIERIAWLPDGGGVLMTAAHREARSINEQIWYVSYPAGEMRQITNDLSDYTGVTLTNDSRTMATVRSEISSDFWIVPNADVSRASKITSGRFMGHDLSWTRDGRLVFASNASGNDDIWLMDADGNGKTQLTHDTAEDYSPTPTPDGRYVVFVSNRHASGNHNLWRMNLDGGDYRRLTKGHVDAHPHVSADSRWVVYSSYDAGRRTLWKVPVEGGDPVQVTERVSSWPVVSPNSRWIAARMSEDPAARLVTAIFPFEGGQPVNIFASISSNRVRWTSSSRALTYVDIHDGIANIWSQPLDDSPPRKLTDFKESRIYSFDWSRDGQLLACERGSTKNTAVLIRSVE